MARALGITPMHGWDAGKPGATAVGNRRPGCFRPRPSGSPRRRAARDLSPKAGRGCWSACKRRLISSAASATPAVGCPSTWPSTPGATPGTLSASSSGCRFMRRGAAAQIFRLMQLKRAAYAPAARGAALRSRARIDLLRTRNQDGSASNRRDPSRPAEPTAPVRRGSYGGVRSRAAHAGQKSGG